MNNIEYLLHKTLNIKQKQNTMGSGQTKTKPQITPDGWAEMIAKSDPNTHAALASALSSNKEATSALSRIGLQFVPIKKIEPKKEKGGHDDDIKLPRWLKAFHVLSTEPSVSSIIQNASFTEAQVLVSSDPASPKALAKLQGQVEQLQAACKWNLFHTFDSLISNTYAAAIEHVTNFFFSCSLYFCFLMKIIFIYYCSSFNRRGSYGNTFFCQVSKINGD